MSNQTGSTNFYQILRTRVTSFTQTPVQVWRKKIFSAVTKKRDVGFSHKASMIGRYTVPTRLPLLRTFHRAVFPLWGANMTDGARARAPCGGHVITYGLFSSARFWVSSKRAPRSQTRKNLQNCTAKNHVCRPKKKRVEQNFHFLRRNSLRTHLRPMCDL